MPVQRSPPPPGPGQRPLDAAQEHRIADPAEGSGGDLPATGVHGNRAIAAILVGAALATGGVMLWTGAADEPAYWLAAPFVFAWICLPYAWIGRSVLRARGALAPGVLVAIGSLLVLAIACWAMWQHVMVTEGPRGGRVFLLLPLWQIVLFAPFAILAGKLSPPADTSTAQAPEPAVQADDRKPS